MKHITFHFVVLFVTCGLILFGIAAPALLETGSLRFVSEVLLVFTMAQVWNLLAGYAGLVSLGQQAFVGLGGYTMYATTGLLGASPYLGIPSGLAVAGIAATLSAPMMFRLRSAYFAIGSWVLAEIVRILITKVDILGGSAGMAFQDVDGFGIAFSTACFWSALFLALIAFAAALALMRSRVGLALMAVRDNEFAAASCGINVNKYRLIVYVLAAAVCGAAGAIYFAQTLFIDTNSAFDINWVVVLLFIVIVGGIGTEVGPVIGTVLYFGVRELFENSEGSYLILIGAIAFVTMMVAPAGIWGSIRNRLGLGAFSTRHKLPESLLKRERERR